VKALPRLQALASTPRYVLMPGRSDPPWAGVTSLGLQYKREGIKTLPILGSRHRHCSVVLGHGCESDRRAGSSSKVQVLPVSGEAPWQGPLHHLHLAPQNQTLLVGRE